MNKIAVDTSAIVACVLSEPGHELLRANLIRSRPLIGQVTWLEAHLVLVGRMGDTGRLLLDEFASFARPEWVAFTELHLAAARDAFDRYGKGRHPAALNFGDCAAYATARVANLPLLFTGQDFALTDLPRA